MEERKGEEEQPYNADGEGEEEEVCTDIDEEEWIVQCGDGVHYISTQTILQFSPLTYNLVKIFNLVLN